MEKPVMGSIYLLFRSLKWGEKRKIINRLHETMVRKPDSEKRRFYKRNIASILSAYREGDVSFDNAVNLLGSVKRRRRKKR